MRIIRIIDRPVYVPGDDINTDRIIPARFMLCITFDGLHKNLFADDREQMKGAHPLDQPDNQGSGILVVDSNFGCGSSREHAVFAIKQWGIRAVVGRSFADIFRGNMTTNGVPCVEVDEQVHAFILEQMRRGAVALNLDLGPMKLSVQITPDHESHQMDITMPEADRANLVIGKWDPIPIMMEAGVSIEEKEASLPYLQA